jgi:hypothetical protein
MSSIPTPRRPPAVCEVARAFGDLVGRPWNEPGGGPNACSPDTPESRDFPANPTGGAKYALCNAHLRDLFEAMGPRTLASPVTASP